MRVARRRHGVLMSEQSANDFRKAAEQGGSEAQSSIGEMYESGLGVPQNYIRAHMWFNLAIYRNQASLDEFSPDMAALLRRVLGDDHFDREAAKMTAARDRVAGKMTAAQIAQAQMMAEQCLRSNYKDCGWPSNLPPLPEGFRLETQPNETNSPPPRHEVTSTGTGFFVSQNGHIVTNAHVADGCQTVRASRGGTLRKISTDEASDLALYVASEKPTSFVRLRGGRGAGLENLLLRSAFP